jgi:hypothetical protein
VTDADTTHSCLPTSAPAAESPLRTGAEQPAAGVGTAPRGVEGAPVAGPSGKGSDADSDEDAGDTDAGDAGDVEVQRQQSGKQVGCGV